MTEPRQPLPIIDPPPPPPRPEDRPPPADPNAAPNDAPNAPAAGQSPASAPAKPDVSLKPTNATEVWRYSGFMAGSHILSERKLMTRQDVFYVIAMGLQFGLSPIASIQNIHMINGKLCMSAAMIVGLIKAHPACIEFRCIESTMERSAWRSRRLNRDGTISEMEMDYTMEEAVMMGLVGKGTTPEKAERNQWHTQPRTMLRWRGATTLGRLEWSDILLGLYSTEEMTDALEVEGEGVRTVEVSKADIAAAKPGGGSVVNLRQLPAPAPADAIDVAFHQAADAKGSREPVPAAKKSTAATRAAERAGQARGRGRPTHHEDDDRPPPDLADLFDGPKCGRCQVPVRPGSDLCDACARG